MPSDTFREYICRVSEGNFEFASAPFIQAFEASPRRPVTMANRSAQFLGSQVGEETEEPLSYTGSPLRLLASDIKLFLHNIVYLPCIFLPIVPCPSGAMDEFYPDFANLADISLHTVLFVFQMAFLISLPILAYLPGAVYSLYILATLGLNYLVCALLNRGVPAEGLKSTEDEYSRTWPQRDDEYWIFLNGICVG